MTKPGEVGYLVILSIFVDVMHRKNSRILCFAEPAQAREICSLHYRPVRAFPCREVFVITSNIQLVPPLRLAALITEELAALRALNIDLPLV